MTISRVELQGQTMRAQDFTNIKHNEDSKVFVDQSNINSRNEVNIEHRLQRVNDSEETDNRQRKFDAKEKGKNEYSGDGGKNRRRNEEGDGKVLIKGAAPHGFDFKV